MKSTGRGVLTHRALSRNRLGDYEEADTFSTRLVAQDSTYFLVMAQDRFSVSVAAPAECVACTANSSTATKSPADVKSGDARAERRAAT